MRMTSSPKKTEPWWIYAAKWISNLFNPLTSLVLYFIYFATQFLTWQEAIKQFSPILGLLILPVTAWIVWNVKTGRYSNMDVSNRLQRKSLYVFLLLALLTYLIVTYFLFGSLDLVMVFLLVLMLLMQISNYWIKSSMHTAFNVFAAALFFTINPVVGIAWLGLAALVGVSRVVLKRHSVKEVLFGSGIALVVSICYLYFHIQTQSVLPL
ncbi:phosphatase PAP2 family protein [Chryseobacterium sp. A301]